MKQNPSTTQLKVKEQYFIADVYLFKQNVKVIIQKYAYMEGEHPPKFYVHK